MNFLIKLKRLRKLLVYVLIYSHIITFSLPVEFLFAEQGIVPATTMTYKYIAPNGVQVVNIATPNSKGLSHNFYHQFNVDLKGAVLNNTDQTLQSKLAGAIRGNPNIYSGMEASIILNEVVSPNRSFLNGFIEVNGKKADVIIANPWGITANGTGFINTSRAVLTTGKPDVVNGSLNKFKVTGGDILIEGVGIDATEPEYFDLITRSIKVNGQINARNLNIVTGLNNWDYNTREVIPLSSSVSDAPEYALDSTLFGGMYADKIKIVATESGVGVRMRGDLASNVDDIVITSEGTIELRNKTSSKTNIDISYIGNSPDGKILLSGQNSSLSANGEINLTSNKAIEFQNGKVYSGGNLNIVSETLTDIGSSDYFRASESNINIDTIGTTEVNGSSWYSANNFNVNTGEFKVGTNGGQFYIGTDDTNMGRSLNIVANTGDIDLAGAKVVTGRDINLTAVQGSINIGNGSEQFIQSMNDLNLKANVAISNLGSLVANNNFKIDTNNTIDDLIITNTGFIQSGGALSISGYNGGTNATINNTGSGIILGDTLNIQASSLTNDTNAGIQGTNGSTINVTGTLNNKGMMVVSNNTSVDGSITAGTITNSGTIQGKRDVTVSLTNNSISNSGNLLAGNALTVRSTNSSGTLGVTNTGVMQSGGALSISGYNGGTNATINNTGSGIIYGNSLNLKANSINNDYDSNILADRNSNITTNTLNNSGIITLATSNSGILSNLNADNVYNYGTIQSAEDMKILSNTIYNNSNAKIISDGSLELSPKSSLQITNNSGARIEGVGVTINADSLTNKDSAVISSDNGLNINSNNISNSGTIQNKAGYMSINVNGNFNNNGWTSLLINEGGASTLNVGGTLHNEGAIHGNDDFTITSGTLENTGTAGISSLSTLDLRTSNDFINDGALYAGNLLKLTAIDKSITNNGTMDSNYDIEVNAGNFYNISSESNTETGKVRASHDITLNLSGEFKNISGGVPDTPPYTRSAYSPMTQDEFSAYDQSSSADTHNVKFYSGDTDGIGGYSFPFYTEFNFNFDDWGDDKYKDGYDTHIQNLYDPNGQPWSIYRFYLRRWTDNDNDVAYKLEYIKGIHQDDYWEYPVLNNKALITAGSTLNINFGNNGENRGGVLSANVININGSGDFTNNSLKNQINQCLKFYNFSFAIYENNFDDNSKSYERWVRYPENTNGNSMLKFGKDWDDTNWSVEGWTGNYKKVNWGSDTSSDDIDIISLENIALSKYKIINTEFVPSGNGAGIFANELYVNIGGSFNNIGSTSNIDPNTHRATPDGSPIGATTNSITSSGVNGTSTTLVSVNNSFNNGLVGQSFKNAYSGQSFNNNISGQSFSNSISGTNTSAGVNGTNFSNSLSGIGINITLPQNPNGYFVMSRNPNAKYLVEVNPRFGLDSAVYLDSDYLFKKLNLQDNINKNIIRLGDAYYENYLIQQQLIQLTGRPILERYQQNAQAQLEDLFNNAVDVADDLKLVWGVELTKEQVAKLKKDIVWMVKTVVNGREVLVPKVYLCQATKDNVDPSGAVVSTQLASINADSFKNEGGTVKGSKLISLNTKRDIENISGTIEGGNVLLKSEEGSIINKTFSKQIGDGDVWMETEIGKKASIKATENLIMDAGKDIQNIGADISAGKNASLKAGNDIVFDTIEDKTIKTKKEFSEQHNISLGLLSLSDKDTYQSKATKTTEVKNIGSTLKVGENLSINAGNDLTVAGSDIEAGGDAYLKAGRDQKFIAKNDINTTETTEQKVEKETKIGLLSLSTKTRTETTTKIDETGTAKVSSIKTGGNLTREAGNELYDEGTNIDVAGNYIQRAEKITNKEAKDQKLSTESTIIKEKRSSNELFSSDSLYTRKDTVETEKRNIEEKTTTAKVSNIKVGGNFVSISEDKTTFQGTNIDVGGSAYIKGKEVEVLTAKDTHDRTETIEKERKENTFQIGTYEGRAGAGASAGAEMKAGILSGVNANAGAEAHANASGRLDLAKNTYEKTSSKETIKDSEITNKVANIKTGGNFTVETTGGNVTFEGTNVDAGKSVTIDTHGGNFDYKAAKDEKTHERTYTEGKLKNTTSLGIGGEVTTEAHANAEGKANVIGQYYGNAEAGASANTSATLSLKNDTNIEKFSESGREKTTTAKVGTMKSGEDINLRAGKATFEGTNLEGAGSFNADIESFDYKAARNEYERSYSSSKDTHDVGVEVGLKAKAGAEAKAIAEKNAAEFKKEVKGERYAGVGVTASANYNYGKETNEETEKSSTAVVGNMNFGKDVNINSKKDVTFEGTNITAGGGANISSEEGSVQFKSAKDTYERSSETSKLNVGGGANVDIMIYGTGTSGDVKIRGGYEESKEKEKMEISNASNIKTGLGGVNITSKKDIVMEGTNVETEGSAKFEAKEGEFKHMTAKSTYEYDSSSWSVGGEINASMSKTKGSSSKAIGGSVQGGFEGKNIDSTISEAGTIKAGNDVSVKSAKDATFEGSKVEAGGNIDVNAGGDVKVLAAENTYREKSYGVNVDLSVGFEKQTRNQNPTANSGTSPNTANTTNNNVNSSSDNTSSNSGNTKQNVPNKESGADKKFSIDAGGHFSSTSEVNQEGATFKAGNNVDIKSDKGITMQGTEITSGNSVNLTAKDGVKLKDIEDKTSSGGISGGVNFDDKGVVSIKDFEVDANYKTTHKETKITSNNINIKTESKVVNEGAELKGTQNINAKEGVENKGKSKDVELGFGFKDPNVSASAKAQAEAIADSKEGARASAGAEADVKAEGKLGLTARVGDVGAGFNLEGKAEAMAGAYADTKEGTKTIAKAGAEGSSAGFIGIGVAKSEGASKGKAEAVAQKSSNNQVAKVEPPKDVKQMFDKVKMMLKSGKTLDQALKLLGIDKEKFNELQKKYDLKLDK